MSDCSWLAGTKWYVPTENLLAYVCDSTLSKKKAVVDQTLWSITSAENGRFEGSSATELWVAGPGGDFTSISAAVNTLSGIITENGEITITFTPEDATQTVTTGYGHLREVEGAWRMEMQMATGSPSLALHWAYMTEVKQDVQFTPPKGCLDSELRSDEWRGLLNSGWAAVDEELFPGGSVFTITSYRNGYLWGEGETSEGSSLRLAGSVTPEGNLYLLFSISEQAPVTRRGMIEADSDTARMSWTAVEGGEVVGGGKECAASR